MHAQDDYDHLRESADAARVDPGWPHDYGQYCECPECGGPAEPLLDGVAAHIPTTPYYDGRDGSLEADEDDEESIADQEAHREEWTDFLDWQRELGARN